MSDLYRIKAGDKVALEEDGTISKVIVDRVTQCQIIINNQKFWRDGLIVGGKRSPRIKAITPEVEQEIAEYQVKVRRNKLIDKIRVVAFCKVPMETLVGVAKLLGVDDE